MNALIGSLLERYEKGKLSRRSLIQALTAVACMDAGAHLEAQETGLRGLRIDHVSVQVIDLPRAVEFYQKTFGLTVVSEDKSNEIVRLGAANKVLVSLHHKNPTGLVDHFAISVDSFQKERVAGELKRLGLAPSENIDAGFHILDPEGMRVQIV